VRGLIIIVLLVGGWLGWVARSERIQREAVAAILGAGGWVVYDSKSTYMGPAHANPITGQPHAALDAISANYFHHVSSAGLPAEISDRDLAHVGRLPALVSLVLDGRNLTDAGLAHLTGLTNLSDLTFSHPDFIIPIQITDAGLAHLNGLRNLSKLSLHCTQVTGTGLDHLKGLAKLSNLDLSNSRVTDAGVAHLKGMNNLTALNLNGCRITDAGLVHLKDLRNLSVLYISFTRVTNDGERALAQALPGLSIWRLR
jgi:hypothetical protein